MRTAGTRALPPAPRSINRVVVCCYVSFFYYSRLTGFLYFSNDPEFLLLTVLLSAVTRKFRYGRTIEFLSSSFCLYFLFLGGGVFCNKV